MGDHRIEAPSSNGGAPADGSSVAVPSARLDTLCATELEEDLLIWMDVQGFEGYALAGAAALLSRRIPLALEFWPSAMAKSGSFPLLLTALASYERFLDLNEPANVRPISELQQFHEEIGVDGRSTDILVL
jgi:hypothetical protein